MRRFNYVYMLLLGVHVSYFVTLCLCRPHRTKRLVHGFPADKNEFPWSVSMIYFQNEGVRFCGGSILDEQWIMTAAHCFSKYGNTTELDLTTDSWLARVGTNAHWTESELWRYRLKVDPVTQLYIYDLKITEIVVYPDFKPDTVMNDIALVRLEKRLNFSDTSSIQPVRLPTKALMESVVVGTKCTMSGWGCTTRDAFERRAGDSPARHQRKANMYLFYTSVCQWLYGPFMNSSTDICAISRRHHVNLCGGDSGGPLVCYDRNGLPFQAGIASGVFTKSPFWYGNPPAKFTRVSHYLKWIVDVTTRSRKTNCKQTT